jgi:hypothetical protein
MPTSAPPALAFGRFFAFMIRFEAPVTQNARVDPPHVSKNAHGLERKRVDGAARHTSEGPASTALRFVCAPEDLGLIEIAAFALGARRRSSGAVSRASTRSAFSSLSMSLPVKRCGVPCGRGAGVQRYFGQRARMTFDPITARSAS